ncbi:unnamed protein product, partial [Polarella glacialis]
DDAEDPRADTGEAEVVGADEEMSSLEVMQHQVVLMSLGAVNVSEVYGAPRVTLQTPGFGLVPGSSFDLTAPDPTTGEGWNFSRADHRQQVRQRILEEKPTLLIGSPVVQKMREDGQQRLEFCVELYNLQMDGGHFFLHEHPDHASSWQVKVTKGILEDQRVRRVMGNMCAQGMVSWDLEGEELVKKSTGYATNSEFIARRVELKCSNGAAAKPGRRGEPWHRHVHLMSGRAKLAQQYPPKLVANVLAGLKEEMVGKGMLGSMDSGPTCQEAEFDFADMEEGIRAEIADYWDNVSGKPLPAHLVHEARDEEIAEITKRKIYVKCPVSECWQNTGKRPIGVRWVDVNKGDESNPEIRCRLVAKEIRRTATADFFAATPPLESLRYILSRARTGRLERLRRGVKLKIQFIDIRKAHFCAKATRLVYVDLPKEDPSYEEGFCARLLMSMYGTQDAAQNWEAEYTDCLTAMGFIAGIGSPCIFMHEERGLETSVHGDDFTTLGQEKDLLWFAEKLKERYEIKERGIMGPDARDKKDMIILNRLVSWQDDKITWEADPRHAELLMHSAGVDRDNAKGVTTAGVSERIYDDDNSEQLEGKDATDYRSFTMRAAYLGQDRPDIQFAAKELARSMQKPTKRDVFKCKRLARYLKYRPRLVWEYSDQPDTDHLAFYSDTDDAGCIRTRKSTSCGFLFHGSHLLKSYSSTQAVVSLSSGESEFYGIIKGASTALGAKAMCADFGRNVGVKLYSDATAGIKMSSRKGFGKAKHIARCYLWVQQRVRDKGLQVLKVGADENVADLGTKHLAEAKVKYLLDKCKCVFKTGKHRMAPAFYFVLEYFVTFEALRRRLSRKARVLLVQKEKALWSGFTAIYQAAFGYTDFCRCMEATEFYSHLAHMVRAAEMRKVSFAGHIWHMINGSRPQQTPLHGHSCSYSEAVFDMTPQATLSAVFTSQCLPGDIAMQLIKIQNCILEQDITKVLVLQQSVLQLASYTADCLDEDFWGFSLRDLAVEQAKLVWKLAKREAGSRSLGRLFQAQLAWSPGRGVESDLQRPPWHTQCGPHHISGPVRLHAPPSFLPKPGAPPVLGPVCTEIGRFWLHLGLQQLQTLGASRPQQQQQQPQQQPQQHQPQQQQQPQSQQQQHQQQQQKQQHTLAIIPITYAWNSNIWHHMHWWIP